MFPLRTDLLAVTPHHVLHAHLTQMLRRLQTHRGFTLLAGFNFHSFSIWEGLTRQNIYMNIFQSNLNSDLSESSWRSGPALVQDIFGQVLAEVHEERVAHIIQEILVLWTALLVTVDEAFDEPDGETRKELESSKTSNIKFLHSNPKRNIRMKQHPYIFF